MPRRTIHSRYFKRTMLILNHNVSCLEMILLVWWKFVVLDIRFYNNTWSAMWPVAEVSRVISIVTVGFKLIFVRKMSFRHCLYVYDVIRMSWKRWGFLLWWLNFRYIHQVYLIIRIYWKLLLHLSQDLLWILHSFLYPFPLPDFFYAYF